MNLFHRRFCNSKLWRSTMRLHLLPRALEGLDLGPSLLELGPGYGASTDLLLPHCESLTCVESDQRLARARKPANRPSQTHAAQADSSSSFKPLPA
jgi:16S rRNA A1518/A1519 N6-dimethyltransferase RsmA/KsgA/DIM1 with predicted DNA glycosylase/AP lyase activity